MREKGSKMPQQNEHTPLLVRVPLDTSRRNGYPHTTVRLCDTETTTHDVELTRDYSSSDVS